MGTDWKPRDLAFGLKGDARMIARAAQRLMSSRPTKEIPMGHDRFHLDRVSAYVGALPDGSGMPRFNPNDDRNRLNDALCVAANLHNPQLVAALTKHRSTNESADDLERMADSDGVDAPTAVSMRRVARALREHTPEEAR